MKTSIFRLYLLKNKKGGAVKSDPISTTGVKMFAKYIRHGISVQVIILVVMLSACAAPTTLPVQPTAQFTATVPVVTPTRTLTPTPTLVDFHAQQTAILATRWAGFNQELLNTPRPSPTATPTLIPRIVTYPVKKVLLSYFSVHCCGSPFDYRGEIYPWGDHIYLYTDGQLILNNNGKLWEKQLSKTEIDGMITALRQLGFFDLAADNMDNQNNSIYHFGPGDYFAYSDMLSTFISLFGEKPASLSIYEEYMKFITQPVKNVLYYLDHYNPPGLASYEPDRVLLQVEPGRAEWVRADATAIPWPDGITPLNKQTFDDILYLEGKEASQFSRLPGNFFLYKGEEYSVDQLVIFPHECPLMVYPRESLDLAEDYQPYFYCSTP